ncbi:MULTISPECIES: hypothetical protein [Luteibacter]|uniref:hypothetical protein n=1 Tax=Luteibacter TaxID=242605 RepID=UPI000559DBE7|nr:MULTISPECIES: hypothetical protein [unclassified Luteibacter]
MLMHFLRLAGWRSGAVLFAAMNILVALPATAGTYAYGPGGLPDLSGYPIGRSDFAAMSAGLGSPVSLDADGANQITSAIFWVPAQGYSVPAPITPSGQVAQAVSSGFFSRLRSQAVGTVAGMVPGVGGVVAGQAANAVATSATSVGANGQAIPGWWCRATYPAPGYRLASVSCSPHAYTPLR